MDIQRKLNVIRLFDCYGKLLTDNQQDQIRSYYLLDMSLAEIAEETGVSRQAVRDGIKRAESALFDFEHKVGFLAYMDEVEGQKSKG